MQFRSARGSADRKRHIALATTLSAAVVGGVAVTAMPAHSATSPTGTQAATTLNAMQTTPLAGGAYAVGNNEWGSSAPESIATDGNAGFTVASSSIHNVTNGAPGGYPSIYSGCHWGNCTRGGLGTSPVPVTALTRRGTVTTSWDTSQPGGSAAYDVAYDIWFNQAPTTTGQPNGAELMIWLNHHGGVQPFGSPVGSASINGVSYTVWEGAQSWGDTVSYVMNSPTTSVHNVDVGGLAADATSRGYVKKSWYLIDIEAGFELWRGGTGLATKSFSVKVNGSAPAKPSEPAPAKPSGPAPAKPSEQAPAKPSEPAPAQPAPSPASVTGMSLQAISPSPTTPGTATNATLDFKNTASAMASDVTVTAKVLNSAGAVVGSQSWPGQNVAPQETLSQTYAWQAAAPGNYTVEGIVQDASGKTLQQEQVGTITVK
jgi:cellulose 1,4-beta-cellobiosidase